MKNLYEVGQVYIWQNQTGELAYLNGTECTVLGDMCEWGGENLPGFWGQETDSLSSDDMGVFSWIAEAGDLRPKGTPSGESSITDLFKLPELEPA